MGAEGSCGRSTAGGQVERGLMQRSPARGPFACTLFAALAVVCLGSTATPAQEPAETLEVLLKKVAASTQLFVDNLTNVVAEEQYTQRFRKIAPSRRLKSDFLLVRYPGEENIFLTFRDVLEVDGRPLQDQQARVLKLFTEPYQDAVRRAGEIQRAGANHSLPRGRLSDPLSLLAFLQEDYQKNFAFKLRGFERSLGADVRELELEQIIEPGTTQPPMRGSVWVSFATGQIAKTEMRTGTGSSVRFTTTTFGVDPVLKVLVPVEMRDAVPVGADDEFLGNAKYGNFRRFQVRAAQEVDLPQDSPGATPR
jgi:hypothetical protein